MIRTKALKGFRVAWLLLAMAMLFALREKMPPPSDMMLVS